MKINRIEIYLYELMMIFIFLTYFNMFSFSWVLKDVGVFLFLIYFFIRKKTIYINFPSFGFMLLYLIMLLVIIIHFIYFGFSAVSLISIRFLFIYLLLILVGYNLGKYFTEKSIFRTIYLIYWFIALIGLVEIIFPELVHAYSVGDNINALRRSGLGFGLGSLFGDRVVFGFVLIYLLIINRIFVQKQFLLFVLQIFVFSLITLTLSKTAIFTALVILTIDIIQVISSKKTSNILVKITFIGFIFLSLLYMFYQFNDLIETLVLAINSSDFTSLSGRTDNWNKLEFSLVPNLFYVGSSDTLGVGFKIVVDNAFLRLIINFGLLVLIPIIIIIFELIKNWKNIDDTLKYTLLLLLMYSITIDFYHIVIVVVPIWFSIGYYIFKLKESKNINAN